MKRIILAIVAISAMLSGTEVFAQGKWGADSAECIKYMSYYKEYYKQKGYDEATPNWRKAYRLCPKTASQNMLIDGAFLLRRLIPMTNDVKYRNTLVDSLLALNNFRAQYYPKYAAAAFNSKGIDLHNYVKNDARKLYDGFEEIISRNGEDTKASFLLYDLQAAVDLYRDGAIDADKVIQTYQRNSDLLDSLKAENDAEAALNANVKQDMGSVFAASKVASCDNLIQLYTPRFAADPENLQLSTSIVKTMSLTEDCTGNDLYLKAATVVNKLNPSANSAYYLFKLNSSRGNVEDAIKYMQEAIASEGSDAQKDAEWTYELATFCYKNGRSAQAIEYASKVASSSKELAGKAYFLIGTAWGSSRCGGDEIAKRAPYWVACDYLSKAKAADPSLADEANRLIGQFSSYFPQAADAFMYDITNGQSYTVVCNGMRATTVVRTVK